MPSQETVRKLLEAIKRPADHDYFFDKLSSGDWIQPLWEAGLFRDPPASVREGDYISFPSWAESRYLARTAAQAPDAALKVILEAPETDNVRVHSDLAEAAAALPPTLAKRAVPRVIRWLDSPYQLILPEKAASLASHLASGGEVKAAMALARALFGFLHGDQDSTDRDEDERGKPRPRLDAWRYAQSLKAVLPSLAASDGLEALRFVCDLLVQSLGSSQSKDATDLSPLWLSAVEDHEQNVDFGVSSALVRAVRDIASDLISSGALPLGNIVGLLDGYGRGVFRRIALHLVRVFADRDPRLVTAKLTDKEVFDAVGERHEYVLLLAERFAGLDGESRRTILGWIEAGHDQDKLRTWPDDDGTVPPSAETVEKRVRAWQARRLAPIRHALPEEWQHRYEALVAEFGEPEHPEFERFTTSFVGPTSPKSGADLRALPTRDLAAYLREWQPTGDFFGPSPEGLGREVSAVAAADPARYSADAGEFRGLDPTYVRGLLDGLKEAAQNDHRLTWAPVLDLCKWAIEQHDPLNPVGKDLDRDVGWEWCRGAVADLLHAGFQNEGSGLGLEARQAAWGVLEPLTQDPDPTPEHESVYGGSNMDPSTLSLNTVRGKAMHALIRYVRWVQRMSGHGSTTAGGMDRVPEARQALEQRLDPGTEPSLAIRSVYGQWFPSLLATDVDWATGQRERIFPADAAERELWWAAWEAYLGFWEPNDRAFEVLREAYARAVELVGSERTERRRFADPDRRLGVHLVVFYVRGLVSFDSEGLLGAYYERATGPLRAHVAEFAGRLLRSQQKALPQPMMERLQSFWNARLEEAETSGYSEERAEELAAFGWWFSSGKLDPAWGLKTLAATLKAARKIDAARLVVQQLAELATEHPGEALGCLELIAGSKLPHWDMDLASEESRRIVRAALDAGEPVRTRAVDFVHRMGASGTDAFQDLIA